MWNSIECFKAEESPYHPGKFTIKPIHENFHLTYTEGSFNVICARLFGLSYAQYLRMCRDLFQAEIIGKGNLYPVAYFKEDENLSRLVKTLNSMANLVLWERAHPNWKAHQKAVEIEEKKAAMKKSLSKKNEVKQ